MSVFVCHCFHFDKSIIFMIFCDHITIFVIFACCYFELIPYINANINKQVRAGVDDELYILNEVYLTEIDAHTSHHIIEKKI